MSKPTQVVYVERVRRSERPVEERFNVVRVEGRISPLPGDEVDAARLQSLISSGVRVVIDRKRNAS